MYHSYKTSLITSDFPSAQKQLPLEQHLTVQLVNCDRTRVRPGDRVQKALFLQCLLKDMCHRASKQLFVNPAPTSATGFIIINSRASDPALHPVAPSVHLHTCCLCCYAVVQAIVSKDIFKSYALWETEPSKNKWMACFWDLRTLKSPPFALLLTLKWLMMSKLCLAFGCHPSSCLALSLPGLFFIYYSRLFLLSQIYRGFI